VLGFRPARAFPSQLAAMDTVGKKNLYAWIARVRSASSYACCTVLVVG